MIIRKRFRTLVRYLASECPEEERREVENWINASDKKREFFDEIKSVWYIFQPHSPKGQTFGTNKTPVGWNSKRAFKKLISGIEKSSGGKRENEGFKLYRIIPQRGEQHSFTFRSLLKIAATMAFFAGTIYILNYLRNETLTKKWNVGDKPAFALNEVSTKIGQQVVLNFSDGTKVILNSTSHLKYSESTEGTRDIYLVGEAYFDVKNSNEHPLIVHTDHAIIRDIGTKFDVESWSDDAETQVAVAEGKILIEPTSYPQEGTIVARDQYSVVKGGKIVTLPTYTDVRRKTEWIEGKLAFYNEPISSVIKQLWRNYGLKCFVADSSILSRTITSTLSNKISPDEALNIIGLSLNITYRTSNDSVLFVPSKPQLKWTKNKSIGRIKL